MPIRLAAALTMAMVCAGSPSTARPLTASATSPHYIYSFAANDGVNIAWQETYIEWALTTIGVTIDRPIHYYKYISREHMRDVIGIGNSNAFARPQVFALHTLWRADNHETIHLLASRFAPDGAVPLFAEGFAVAHQVNPATGDFTPKWNGRYLAQHLETFFAERRFVSPQQMLTAKSFRAVPDVVSYPISGAFVHYLIDRFGYGPVKELLRRGNPADTGAAVRETFTAAFGMPIDDVERAWLQTVRGAPR